MPDIDPKSIPVLDDIIEGKKAAPDAADAADGVSEAGDDLFSPASILDANEPAPVPADAGLTDSETDKSEAPEPVLADVNGAGPDPADHIDAISALDGSTPPVEAGIDADVDIGATKLELQQQPAAGITTGAVGSMADPQDASPDTWPDRDRGSPDINTTEVTELIIDRLMPEIEQRLRVIIDLTLRETIKKNSKK